MTKDEKLVYAQTTIQRIRDLCYAAEYENAPKAIGTCISIAEEALLELADIKRYPRSVKKIMDGLGETPSGFSGYILRQLDFFNSLSNKATDEAGWIALKCSCSYAQGKAIIEWVRAQEKHARPSK